MNINKYLQISTIYKKEEPDVILIINWQIFSFIFISIKLRTINIIIIKA